MLYMIGSLYSAKHLFGFVLGFTDYSLFVLRSLWKPAALEAGELFMADLLLNSY